MLFPSMQQDDDHKTESNAAQVDHGSTTEQESTAEAKQSDSQEGEAKKEDVAKQDSTKPAAQKTEETKSDEHAADEHATDEHAADEHATESKQDHADETHSSEAGDDHVDHDHDTSGHDAASHESGHDDAGHDDAGHDDAGHDDAGHDDAGHGHGTPDYLSTEELFKHVQDSDEFHFPPTITRMFCEEDDTSSDLYHGHVKLPQVAILKTPLKFDSPHIQPLDFHFTRFMAVELMAAVFVFVIFTAVAQKLKKGGVPKGRLWNLFEALVQFIRRDVGQAIIGKKDGAKYAPFLLTIFFFVLGCNLLGMVPGLGAPTGDFVVTATLALIVFIVVVKAGIEKFGLGGFIKNLVPTMDLPPALKIALVPMIFVIEVVGFLIKHFVLAVRLFANLMAGHLVLAAIVAFIGVTHGEWFGTLVKPASVLGATALSVLEVFVAFLQAYIFTFLTALFISSATHHH